MFWLLICPPIIAIGIALIIYTIGLAGVAGVAVSRYLAWSARTRLILSCSYLHLPSKVRSSTKQLTTAYLFVALVKLDKKHLEALDSRTTTLTEVVRNLHSVKLFAYEPHFARVLADKRETEAGFAQRSIILRSTGNIVALFLPAIAAVGGY